MKFIAEQTFDELLPELKKAGWDLPENDRGVRASKKKNLWLIQSQFS